MPGMRRADRRNSNSDNERNNPRSSHQEPISYHELKQQRDNARADKALLQQEKAQLQQEFQTSQLVVSTLEERATQNHQLYLGEQQKYQQTLCLYNTEKARATSLLFKYEEANTQIQTSQLLISQLEDRVTQTHQLYLGEQQKYQQTLCLYEQERERANDLLAKYEEADAQRAQYLNQYNEAQAQLKHERRSKAGIKGWETRRKMENERLKREIGEMTVLLHESLTRKDEAVSNLYLLAERMDRIQQLVDSVEEESTSSPISLLQKLKRIWLSIKDILTE